MHLIRLQEYLELVQPIREFDVLRHIMKKTNITPEMDFGDRTADETQRFGLDARELRNNLIDVARKIEGLIKLGVAPDKRVYETLDFIIPDGLKTIAPDNYEQIQATVQFILTVSGKSNDTQTI